MIKLKQKKYRHIFKSYIIEGYHLLEEANKMGLLDMVFSLEDMGFLDVETHLVSKDIMRKLSDLESPPGIIGVCKMGKVAPVEGNTLLLDRLQDPGNMGTLLRSALAFGFKNIVVDQCVDVYNSKVLRATQGAIFKVNIIEDDIIDFMNKYKDYYFLATDLKSSNSLESIDSALLNKGLILGNEGSGVRQEIIDKADISLKIKMHNTESLNAGVAGSIIMYYLGE